MGDPQGPSTRLLVPVGIAILLAVLGVFATVVFEARGPLPIVLVGGAAGALLGYWAISGWSERTDDADDEDRWR